MVPRAIGIIGHGNFGRFIEMLANTFLPDADVFVHSRRETPDGTRFFSLEDACRADIVIIAVSIRSFEEVLLKVLPLLGKESVLVEVNTVKTMPVGLLRAHASGVRYVATHPMFGPYSFEKQGESLTGLRLVIADHALEEQEFAAVTAILENLGLSVLSMSAEDHDRMLAETLFLTHYLAQSVTRAGFVRTDIDTLSFGYLMDAVESVRNDTELFKDVYEFNPYCREVIERFEEAERATKHLLEKPQL